MYIIKDRFLKNRLLKGVIIIALLYIFFSALTIIFIFCCYLLKVVIIKSLNALLLKMGIKKGIEKVVDEVLFRKGIKKNLEDVLLQIWIVQVTFTTILIAFITVLLSEMRIKFYGIKVLEVIDLKTTFWSMFFGVLGINILTYVPVVIWKSFMFTTIDYFIISFVSIYYIWESLNTLSHPEKYKKLVRELYEDNIKRGGYFQTNRGKIISLYV